MKSEDRARQFFEQYLKRLAMDVDKEENGKYKSDHVQASWKAFMAVWLQLRLVTFEDAREELDRGAHANW